MRRRLTSAGLLVVVAAACSIESAMPPPDCIEGGSANLAAQSVPTARLVPCFDRLPAGWEADHVLVDQNGTVVRFDSDRAGDNAAIFHYTETCDPGDAVSSPSEHDDADRFDFVERVDPGFRAQRFYVFEGGCMWWEFDFDDDATAALAIELGDRLVTVPRDVVNEQVREAFIDEDL